MRERPYKTCVALKDIGSCKINKKIAKKKKAYLTQFVQLIGLYLIIRFSMKKE